MRKKVAIVAGHYSGSPGVVNKELSLIEFQEAEKVVSIVTKHLEKDYIVINAYGTIYEKIKQLKNHVLECLIEIHFNAFQESPGQSEVEGSMTLYCPLSKSGKMLARSIQKGLVEYLNTDDLGIRLGYYQLDPKKGMLPMLCRTKPPAVIVEPLYMDDIKEAKRLIDEKNIHAKIALAIVQGIRRFLC